MPGSSVSQRLDTNVLVLALVMALVMALVIVLVLALVLVLYTVLIRPDSKALWAIQAIQGNTGPYRP